MQKAINAHQGGHLESAQAIYGKVLEVRPNHPGALANLALLLRRQGDVEGAKARYRQILALRQPPPEARFNYGNLLLDEGDANAALAQFDDLLARLPRHLPALLQRARCLRDLGRLADARATYHTLLGAMPGHSDALLELGNVQRALLECAQARATYSQLVRIQPGNWKGHYSLARLLGEMGESELSAQHMQTAADCAPDRATVLFPYAQSLVSEGHHDKAKAVLGQLLRVQPEHQPARIELAAALMRLGNSAAAYSHFQKVSTSQDIKILTRLADVSMGFNRWEEALAVLRRVVALAPDNPDARRNLAAGCVTAWQLTEALETCEQFSVRFGADSTVQRLIGNVQLKRGDVEAALAAFRDETELGSGLEARLNFTALYSDQFTAEDTFAQHLRSAQVIEHGTIAVDLEKHDRSSERLLKLGYITADLHHQHPVDIYLQPVFEHHDRGAFRTTIFYSGKGYDARTQRARGLADQWYEVGDWADERFIEQIRRDRIDILIDLSGHTSGNRLPVFARHPAPVQMCMVAYPHSTGLKAMDYFLADPVLAPPGCAALYSEKLLHLERCIFCYPRDLHGPAPPRERGGPVVFGSFNNVPKLTPTTVRLWAAVLIAAPDSRLLLKAPSFQDPGCVARYRNLFVGQGISGSRLEFRGPTGLEQMMLEYRDVDVALDPVPFNGGTTTQQALWAGTPVVTLAGRSFSQRMGASNLTYLGYPQWVAGSAREYIQIAADLASDSEKLRRIQVELAKKMRTSSVTDNIAYTRNLENLYRSAWREWCDNRQGPA